MYKVLFTADLHGNKKKFEDFFNLDADVYIIGGDLLTVEGSFNEIYQNQKKFAETFLLKILKEKEGTSEILLMSGNDDLVFIENLIDKWEQQGLCKQLHGKKYIYDGIEIIGFRFVPPTPFSLKNFERKDERELEAQFLNACIFEPDGTYTQINFQNFLERNKSISELLEELIKPVNFKKTVYIMHSPPYNSGLDKVYDGKIVGSIDIRKFIEKYQPALVLCGHIHESGGICYIGKTTCINVGQIGVKLHYISFNINKQKIQNILPC